LNELVSFNKGTTSASYLYDAGGRRIKKTSNGATTWYIWDRSRLLAEYDASGSRTARYFYLEDDAVPFRVDDSTGTYYVHSDRLQSPRFVTGNSGQIVWRGRHDAFGRYIVENDVDGDGHSFRLDARMPGQLEDSESGL
jgi:uncharacterized protein RhaS with RHS repeats